MIIVKLIGGLGNQMFQYAVGRRLAYIHNTLLKLDISGFETYKVHEYCLNNFKIVESIVLKNKLLQTKPRIPNGIIGFIRGLTKRSAPVIVKEKFYHFDQAILELPDNVYLDGYWQSEKYFKDSSDIIRKEFQVKYLLKGKNKKIAQQIKNNQSVSIHIRRGDYLANPEAKKLYAPCSLKYYQKCISRICKKFKKPFFFVFSDDIKWAKSNLKIDHPVIFIGHNRNKKNYEDMRLMSKCKHNIIANSTFSWWGAWLNSNSGKLVFAPKKWFSDASIKTTDLIPHSWIRM